MQTSIFVLNCCSLKRIKSAEMKNKKKNEKTNCWLSNLKHFIENTLCWMQRFYFSLFILWSGDVLHSIYSVYRAVYVYFFIIVRYNIIIIQFSCLKALKDIQENEYIKMVFGCIKSYFWQLHFFCDYSARQSKMH